MGDVNIGLDGNQIMQRWLARRIFREVEFRIVETDGTEHVGFVTGFDAECMQMSTTPKHVADAPRSVLIFWPIRRIEETGGRVEDLDPDHRSKIRSYSHALRMHCDAALKNGSSQGRSRRIDADDPDLFSENL